MQHELGSMSVLADPLRKHVRLDHDAEAQAASCCVVGSWKTIHQGMAELYGEAKRNLNSEADAQANVAAGLIAGEFAEKRAI
ncbi:hypothetical protein WN944_029487 [Citrus x changshan-huyou]|uniref:Uncharacterized protein n=1 Tax=Citrus x changshan-huyou TaxID=2935761 RepID=A0AAP0LM51_9ROSI